jgi:hypothetical protein
MARRNAINVSVTDDSATLDVDQGNSVINNNSETRTYIEKNFTSGTVGESGYSHTGAFADKPASAQYVWEFGDVDEGVQYSAADVATSKYKVFSLSEEVHEQVDNPYWSIPTPSGVKGIGLFQGANLPKGIDGLFEFDYDYDVENANITHNYYALNEGTETGYEGSTGRIKLNDLQYGDQLRVRFEFNVIPQHANTTVTPALWYSNRNADDEITFTFALTTQPIFFGTGTVGKQFDNRVEISAWITSDEDVNAIALPAIKSDQEVIIQPLGMLVTIIR